MKGRCYRLVPRLQAYNVTLAAFDTPIPFGRHIFVRSPAAHRPFVTESHRQPLLTYCKNEHRSNPTCGYSVQ